MNQAQLTAVTETFKTSKYNNPHIAAEQVVPLDDWVVKGKPFCWHQVETANGYFAFVDSGYGFMALFKGDELLAWGTDELVTDHVVMLNKIYYNASKYLWF